MNLILVGFMASGKTTIGRRLSQRLGYSFLDTDQFVESEIGCSIAELFSIQGEEYFRTLETRLAGRLTRMENSVIATGGGMIMTPGNLERLRAAGILIFLKAAREDLITRLERDTRRPKVRNGDIGETVTKMMDERLPTYSQSDIIVETKSKSINRVCTEILRKVSEFQQEGRQTSA